MDSTRKDNSCLFKQTLLFFKLALVFFSESKEFTEQHSYTQAEKETSGRGGSQGRQSLRINKCLEKLATLGNDTLRYRDSTDRELDMLTKFSSVLCPRSMTCLTFSDQTTMMCLG